MKNLRLKVYTLLVISGFTILAFGSGDDKPSASDTYEYCSIHEQMYNPNNAYKGCSECVKEKERDSFKESLERARRL
jgi:hypothetical protein